MEQNPKGRWNTSRAAHWNNFGLDLLGSYPHEVYEIIHGDETEGEGLLRIVAHLEDKAKRLMQSKRLPTDILSLLRINEVSLGYVYASARNVIIEAESIRASLRENNTEKCAISMLQFSLSAMRVSAFDLVWNEVNRLVGAKSGGKATKHNAGFVRAISYALIETGSTVFKDVLSFLEKFTSYSPLLVEGFEVYVDGDSITAQDKSTDKETTITTTSLKRYLTRAKAPKNRSK